MRHLSKARLMGVGLLLLVLSSGVVRAEQPQHAGGPGLTSDTSPFLTSRPVRMTLGTAAGLAGGALTIATSTLAVCVLTNGGSGYCAISGLFLGALLSPLGIGGGAWLVGKHLDGNGSYLAAALAAAGGFLVSTLLVVNLAPTSVPVMAQILTAATMPPFFAALAYELTSDASRSQASARLAPAVLGRNAPGLVLSGQF